MEELFKILEDSRVYSEELQTEVIPVEVVYDVVGQMIEQQVENTYRILSEKLENLSQDFNIDIE